MKPGRNDPCPCGSGKKHKNCCLGKIGFSDEPTAMEMRGTPNLATGALKDIRRIAVDREFKSADEFQAFLDSWIAIKNSQPIADFAGLSPEVAVRWFDEAFEIEESPRVREIMRPKSESGHITLVRFRTCVSLAGFAEIKSSKLCITEKGRAILAREDWETLYRELFAAMIALYNDTENPVNDRMIDGAGEWTLFALHLIARSESDSIKIGELCAAYRRAFPQNFDDLDDDGLSYFVFADAILPARELGILAQNPLPERIEDYDTIDGEPVARTAFGKQHVVWKR